MSSFKSVDMKGLTTSLNMNLMIVADTSPVSLHYNLNHLASNVPQTLIDLGKKDVDLVARECRIRLKDQGMNDLMVVLDTISEIIKEKKGYVDNS